MDITTIYALIGATAIMVAVFFGWRLRQIVKARRKTGIRSSPVSLILVLALFATGVKYFYNLTATGKPNADALSYTIEESVNEQVFVCKLQVDPNFLLLGSIKVLIKEAWIEKCSDHEFYYVWFHRRKIKPGYKIVIKPEDNSAPSGNTLWLPNSGRSFGSAGSYFIFQETVDAIPPDEFFIKNENRFGESVQTLKISLSNQSTHSITASGNSE